jgi:predicted AAA+ superfamily ATPase
MTLSSNESIYKVLSALNTWWQSGAVNADLLREYRRHAYTEAKDRFLDEQIRRFVVLSGARRVGKTTIEYQLIDDLLKSGTAANRILFFPVDQPVLKEAGIQTVLDIYHEYIYAGQDCYIFFDEIQKDKNWENILKSVYDSAPKIHVFATGSASASLEKGTADSGTGRFTTLKIPTLSFYEYCAMLNLDAGIELSDTLTPSKLAALSKQEQSAVLLRLSPLQRHFNRYLSVGGFPELALSDKDARASQSIREDIIDKVLKRDIPEVFNIRNTADLERIFLYICHVSSDVVSIEAMTKELSSVSRPTAEEYLRYLVAGNLVYQSLPISLGGKAVLKASPKLYVADTAMRLAVLMEDPLGSAAVMGKLAETTVYKHLYSFYSRRGAKVGYFRGGDKTKEIDIVVEKPNGAKLLVEAKYREQAKLTEDSALAAFTGEAIGCFLMTKRAEDFGLQPTVGGNAIFRIPAFAFLYLIGHAEKNSASDI